MRTLNLQNREIRSDQRKNSRAKIVFIRTRWTTQIHPAKRTNLVKILSKQNLLNPTDPQVLWVASAVRLTMWAYQLPNNIERARKNLISRVRISRNLPFRNLVIIEKLVNFSVKINTSRPRNKKFIISILMRTHWREKTLPPLTISNTGGKRANRKVSYNFKKSRSAFDNNILTTALLDYYASMHETEVTNDINVLYYCRSIFPLTGLFLLQASFIP